MSTCASPGRRLWWTPCMWEISPGHTCRQPEPCKTHRKPSTSGGSSTTSRMILLIWAMQIWITSWPGTWGLGLSPSSPCLWQCCITSLCCWRLWASCSGPLSDTSPPPTVTWSLYWTPHSPSLTEKHGMILATCPATRGKRQSRALVSGLLLWSHREGCTWKARLPKS